MEKEAKDFFTPSEFQKIAFECGVNNVPDPELEPAFLNPSLMKFGQRFFNIGFNKGTSNAQKVAYEFLKSNCGLGWGEHYLKQVNPSPMYLVDNAMESIVKLAIDRELSKEEIWPVIRALEVVKAAMLESDPEAEK